LEAIKLLTGYGKPLLSQMLVFNTIDMEFRKVNIPKNDQCKVCGDRTFTGSVSALR
jgi:adenylyltransferase/sulfurtransferase